jgi:hypothetical protein
MSFNSTWVTKAFSSSNPPQGARWGICMVRLRLVSVALTERQRVLDGTYIFWMLVLDVTNKIALIPKGVSTTLC